MILTFMNTIVTITAVKKPPTQNTQFNTIHLTVRRCSHEKSAEVSLIATQST